MSVAAIVVAAGQGSRFGGAKQFAELDGTTVAARSVAIARSVAPLVVLVVPPDYEGAGEGADVLVPGGATRSASVRAGLEHCGDASVIIVHDAARPFASVSLFRAVVDAIEEGADAAIPGVGVSDTVKRISRRDGVSVVEETLQRDELIYVQTPQAFRREVLERAHAGADDATDDAALVEALGETVVVVDGEEGNRKITYRNDLSLSATEERR